MAEEERPGRRLAPRGDPERRRWVPLLRAVTAHQHGYATRFGAADGGTLRSRASGLDRASSALSAHHLANTRVWVQLGDARVLERRGDRPALSDHRPVATLWSARRATPPHLRPMPEWVARGADYARRVAGALRSAGLDRLPLNDALRRTKQIMRVSAARARDSILARDPAAKLSRRLLALQAVLALHRGEVRTLERTIREWPALEGVMNIDLASQTVVIQDETKLQILLAEAIQEGGTEEEKQDSERQTPTGVRGRNVGKNSRQRKEAQMRRWAGLWAPHRQRRWLSGVTMDPDEGDEQQQTRVATGEREVARALADYWATRFATPVTDDRLARAIARTFVPKLPKQRWPLPTLHDVGTALLVAKPTAVGPDGLPYTAWRFTGREAWTVFHRLLLRMATTGSAPPSHNDAVGAFPPKGTEPDDTVGGHGLTRRPGATRPLSLRNTDSKTIARLVNGPLTRALQHWVPAQQRGFVAGRGSAEHVIMLDARARAATLRAFGAPDVTRRRPASEPRRPADGRTGHLQDRRRRDATRMTVRAPQARTTGDARGRQGPRRTPARVRQPTTPRRHDTDTPPRRPRNLTPAPTPHAPCPPPPSPLLRLYHSRRSEPGGAQAHLRGARPDNATTHPRHTDHAP